jgi:hypothetical protein
MASPNPENFIPRLPAFGAVQNTPINTNLALNTNFKFTLKKVPNITYFVTSITTPSSSSNPVSLDYLTAVPLKIPGGAANTDVSIRFIIDENYTNYMEMVKWFRSGAPYTNFNEIVPSNLAEPSDGMMLLLNNKKNPFRMVTYRNMIPTQISGFSLSHMESEPSVLTATVTFVYDTFTVTKL